LNPPKEQHVHITCIKENKKTLNMNKILLMLLDLFLETNNKPTAAIAMSPPTIIVVDA
jgi:hypothetical protein